jgi:hypothetical protein
MDKMLQWNIKLFIKKYEELKILIDPYGPDFEYFGQPDTAWLRKVKDIFIEMDAILED